MTLFKKVTLTLSLAVFATSAVFADPVASGGTGGSGNSGGDDNNTVAIVAGLGLLAGAGYLYATGAFAGGFAGTTAGTSGATTTAKVGKTAVKVKAAQQPQRTAKRKPNTHTHPAVPGVTKSMAHTHMGPMPHTHRYGR